MLKCHDKHGHQSSTLQIHVKYSNDQGHERDTNGSMSNKDHSHEKYTMDLSLKINEGYMGKDMENLSFMSTNVWVVLSKCSLGSNINEVMLLQF
jgi:hypothetical protein